jgi:hypothetical protein
MQLCMHVRIYACMHAHPVLACYVPCTGVGLSSDSAVVVYDISSHAVLVNLRDGRDASHVEAERT